MTGHDGDEREPWARRDTGPRGLQRERTMLAWNRTLMALVVSTVLLVRATGPSYLRPIHLPAAGVLVVAAWLWVRSDLRYRRELDPATLVTPAYPATVAGATTVVGVTSIVVLGLT